MKNLQELPKLRDSISYVYFEYAIIEQNNLSIVAVCKDGRIPIPVTATTCLLLGPGTSVTHAAMRTIAENGCMVVWCREDSVRFYASGTGETRSAQNLLRQAAFCMDAEKHMMIVRKMYAMRIYPAQCGDEPHSLRKCRQRMQSTPRNAGMIHDNGMCGRIGLSFTPSIAGMNPADTPSGCRYKHLPCAMRG